MGPRNGLRGALRAPLCTVMGTADLMGLLKPIDNTYLFKEIIILIMKLPRRRLQ